MDKELKQFFISIKFPLLLIAILWLIEGVEQLFSLRFAIYGIFPREIYGLVGILASPFIHSDWSHLISNSFPLLMLSIVMVYFYKRIAVASFLLITITTGVLVWLFARQSYHIGASGVVYGLVSFVFWSGIFRRNVKSIVLALLVLILYSGYFEGLIPKEGISWESHLLGGVSGILYAFLFKNIKEQEDEEYHTENVAYEKSFFLERNVFEKTKQERAYEAFLAEQQRLREIEEEKIRRYQAWINTQNNNY